MKPFVDKLKAYDIDLDLVDDELLVNIPAGLEAGALIAEIRQHKQELISYLRTIPAGAGGGAVPGASAVDGRHYRLSHKEEGKFLLFRMADRCLVPEMDQEVRGFNITRKYRFDDLNLAAFTQAFDQLVRRHDMLRASFGTVNGEPRKYIRSAGTLGPHVEWIDLGPEENPAALEQYARQCARHCFDFGGPRLWKALLLRHGSVHTFVLTINHVIADEWSVMTLKSDFIALYEAALKGVPATLPPVEYSGALIGEWEKRALAGAEGRRARDYWQQCLSGKLPLYYLKDYFRDPALAAGPASYAAGLRRELYQHYAPVTEAEFEALCGTMHRVATIEGRLYRMVIGGPLYRNITDLARENQLTLFDVITTGFCLCWYRLTGNPDVIIGVDKALRGDAFFNTVGWMINTLLIRTRLREDAPVAAALHQVSRNLYQAGQHELYPFDKVLQMHDVAVDAVGSLYLNYLNDRSNDEVIEDASAYHLEETGPAYFDIDSFIRACKNGLEVIIRYKACLFTPETIEKIAGTLPEVLAWMTEAPGRAVAEVRNRG